MVWRKLIYKILMLLSLMAVNTGARAHDNADTVHFIGRYSFTWQGVGLAAAELSIDQDEDSYKVRLAIDTRGVVNLFTHHRSDTMARGRREGTKYFPEIYESRYWTKKKPRHIKVAYDAKGMMTEETVEPPEDRTERPLVPHSLKDKTLDPLAALMAVRAGNLAPRAFDGKALYDGTVKPIASKTPEVIDGRKSVGYVMTRKPVAGMTQKEMTQYKKGEPPLYFYFTDDAARIPLYMKLPLFVGRISGSLVKECKTWDECKVL